MMLQTSPMTGRHVMPEPSSRAFHPASTPDYLPAPQMHELQLARLRAVVRRAYTKIPLFRERMEALHLVPEDIRELHDIGRLPFTVKSDLRDTYPFGLFASPMEEIVRLHASSGTTGKPIVVAYTREDLDVWTSVMVRGFAACGLHSGDIVQNAYGYGLFTGGLGAHYGAEALGATVIPISGGNTDRQIMVMKDFRVTAICCTPSYFLHLLERAGELGVDVRDLPLRVGIFGAEPWTESMRRHIEREGGIQAFDIYGLSEIIGPGVAIECPFHRRSAHLRRPFLPGDRGPGDRRVRCPKARRANWCSPRSASRPCRMIRYRTRDITSLIRRACPCGRTLRRMARIGRRSDDMFIIRGVNVFPSQIETALLAVEGTLPHYQIILTRHKGLDPMEVQVEVTPEVFSDKIGALEALHDRLGTRSNRPSGCGWR